MGRYQRKPSYIFWPSDPICGTGDSPFDCHLKKTQCGAITKMLEPSGGYIKNYIICAKSAAVELGPVFFKNLGWSRRCFVFALFDKKRKIVCGVERDFCLNSMGVVMLSWRRHSSVIQRWLRSRSVTNMDSEIWEGNVGYIQEILEGLGFCWHWKRNYTWAEQEITQKVLNTLVMIKVVEIKSIISKCTFVLIKLEFSSVPVQDTANKTGSIILLFHI